MNNPLKTTSAIKHADWPYIIQHFVYYLLLITAAGLFLSGTGLIIASVILTGFLMLVTFFHLYRIQKKDTDFQTYKFQSISEINSLIPIRAPLPPMTGWAATPELAVTVLKQIIKLKPNLIAGLGSGITTIVNSYGLENYSPEGRLISFDHDETYANKTRQELKTHNLQSYAEVRTAELKQVEINGHSHMWYNPEVLQFPGKIDLLVIDGPPFDTQKYARFPALPLLIQHLARHAVVIVHDTKREEESTIIKRWILEFPEFSVSSLDTDKGITILERRI